MSVFGVRLSRMHLVGLLGLLMVAVGNYLQVHAQDLAAYVHGPAAAAADIITGVGALLAYFGTPLSKES